ALLLLVGVIWLVQRRPGLSIRPEGLRALGGGLGRACRGHEGRLPEAARVPRLGQRQARRAARAEAQETRRWMLALEAGSCCRSGQSWPISGAVRTRPDDAAMTYRQIALVCAVAGLNLAGANLLIDALATRIYNCNP